MEAENKTKSQTRNAKLRPQHNRKLSPKQNKDHSSGNGSCCTNLHSRTRQSTRNEKYMKLREQSNSTKTNKTSKQKMRKINGRVPAKLPLASSILQQYKRPPHLRK
ncbi:unnamed protein product [Pylaiella littoralis]